MSSSWAPKKPNFGKPPPGYIAGLGRGATGFITRSDVGPSKIPEVANVQAAQVDEANYNEAKFDQWEGFQGSLFAKGNLDDQDKQAEDAYDFCEKRIWQRRQKERQLLDKKVKEQPHTDNSITSKFIDLKRDLATVTNEEWEAIPDCVDLSIKKRKRERFAPVPDGLVMNLLSSKEGINSVADDGQNIEDFHDAKEVLLRSKLDNVDNSVTGKSNLDKVGYMTELNSHKLDSEFIGDVKKARMLLKSALSSNPKNPDIWLSAARVQELDGKINDSRQILRKAIQQCPLSQDIWIELSRIEKVDQAKDVLIEGLRFLPASEKLWLYAARRQNQDKELKSKILRKGLENIPTSVKLWRELIEMQSVEDAKKLLYKAVESLPKEIDLWLALAKTEDYKSAQKVLNKARKYNPLSVTIWISAARLEEAQSKVEPIANIAEKIETVLSRGRQTLKKNGANISRQEWLEQAFYAQKSESYLVCQMLVKISISYGLTQQQIRNALVKDVQFYQKQKQSNRTTRFIFHYGIELTKSKDLMKQMIQFEKRRRMKKQYDQLNSTLKFAVRIFESDNLFWKVTIAKLIKERNYDAALGLIEAAITKIDKEQEEDIRLMKVKVYMFQQQYDLARAELQSLRTVFPKGLAILQSIKFEYEVENYDAAWKLCQKYFRQSKSQDIWRLAFRVKQKVGTYAESYAIIQKALGSFPQSLPVWLDIIQFEIENNHTSKSRALIDKAMQKIIKCQQLYILSIQLERKFGNKKQAVFSLAKALKAFPKSPQIWAIAIELQPQNTQKKKASSAIQVCGQNAYINSSVAKLFWKQGKSDKAKKWFEEALKMSPNNGDIWALYVRLLQQSFSTQQEQGRKRFRQTEGQFEGRKWKRVQQNKGGWRLQNQQILEILMKGVDHQIQALN